MKRYVDEPMMRQFWRVKLRNPATPGDGIELFKKWVDGIPEEMGTLHDGNKVLAEFAKEHDLQYHDDDEVIKISEEERLMLMLKLDPRLMLVKQS